MDRSQPNEQQPGLPAGEGSLADGHPVGSAQGDPAREVHPKRRVRRRLRLQRFANHAA